MPLRLVARRVWLPKGEVSAVVLAVHGFNVGPMVGIDFYFNHWISVGADVDAQFLFIQRPKLALPGGLTAAQQNAIQSQPLYNDSGSSAGFQIAPTAHLGIHF